MPELCKVRVTNCEVCTRCNLRSARYTNYKAWSSVQNQVMKFAQSERSREIQVTKCEELVIRCEVQYEVQVAMKFVYSTKYEVHVKFKGEVHVKLVWSLSYEIWSCLQIFSCNGIHLQYEVHAKLRSVKYGCKIWSRVQSTKLCTHSIRFTWSKSSEVWSTSCKMRSHVQNYSEVYVKYQVSAKFTKLWSAKYKL